MSAYYNEHDPYAAEWLRNLVAAGLIARGDVDGRSIVDVRASDLAGYGQCHFFAGIGGWSLALRLAGWPDDRPVWTGSCPCQPFSNAGKRGGTADERHLWPEMFRLVRECRPGTVFGEQVESAVRHGWLDGIFGDLEGEGYACGAAVLGAHSVGAPHIRQRLWWVADAHGGKPRHGDLQPGGQHGQQPQDGRSGGMGDTTIKRCGQGSPVGDGRNPRSDADQGSGPLHPGADFWSAFDLIPCRDGKARRIEPGTFPLAHGVPARVGKLRAYGNAIVPQVAAAFIADYVEIARAA